MLPLIVQAQAPKTVQRATPAPGTIVVYGGTAAGVMAAVSAARLGRNVLLIEPGYHLGGLTTGGLGYTDIGNKYAVQGLALDVYRRLGRRQDKLEAWTFAPSAALEVLQGYLAEPASRRHVRVLMGRRLALTGPRRDLSVRLGPDNRIKNLLLQDAAARRPDTVVAGAAYIDATYEGDLMAAAGVDFAIGREANAQYAETYNGVQLREAHQLPDGIDPYRQPGNPTSGLLYGISADTLTPQGSGDSLVQAYNFRLCLTTDAAHSRPIARPQGYDSSRYELLLRQLAAKPQTSLRTILKVDMVTDDKTDINNQGGFSTDKIGGSHSWWRASYAGRDSIRAAHRDYTQGLLYFIGHDERMPDTLRRQMLRFSYPTDEYVETDHFSPQLYIREARRMRGAYVMTQDNCQGRKTAEDPIALAAYTMDSHNCRRIVITKNGRPMVKNEGDVQIGGFPPYPISYRALVPRVGQCPNLLVPVCLSASHIAYGSIRMEPVFMGLGQVAALAADQALARRIPVQQVDAKAIARRLAQDPRLDGTAPDVAIDDTDTTRLQLQGPLHRRSGVRTCYGATALVADTAPVRGLAPAATYTAHLPKAGRYTVYIYCPRGRGQSPYTLLARLEAPRLRHEQSIDPYVEAESAAGQGSGIWLPIGTHALPAGAPVRLTLLPTPGGLADAVQFVWQGM